MNKRREGNRGEMQVAEYLSDKGYRIRAMNYTCKAGEIDIVAEKTGIIVFVEVKSRSNCSYGRPSEAVTPGKLRKIERSAQWYLLQNRLTGFPARIDVAEVFWENGSVRIEHIENVTG